MFKTIQGYAIEIIIGILIISFWNTEAFLVYFFIIYLITSERRTDYLRKLVRTLHIANEVKILSIMRKLGVKSSDAGKIFEEMEKNMTEKAYKELEKDFADVSNLNNLKDISEE